MEMGDNIKVKLRKTGYDVDWTETAQDRGRAHYFVSRTNIQ
jgi:hypothetical protein